jgi:hypothetical protein
MLRLKNTSSGDYKFQKVFSEGEFLASGMLLIPKGREKPNKNTHQSAMVITNLIFLDFCGSERNDRSYSASHCFSSWSRLSILRSSRYFQI